MSAGSYNHLREKSEVLTKGFLNKHLRFPLPVILNPFFLFLVSTEYIDAKFPPLFETLLVSKTKFPWTFKSISDLYSVLSIFLYFSL